MMQQVEKIFIMFTKHVAVRFFISGGTSAFVNLSLLFLLNSVLNIYYLTSAVLAFIGAFGVSFTLHKFWTFKSHGEGAHKQVVMYLQTSLVALLLNTFLMYIFVDYFGFIVLIAQVVVGLIVAVFSFFMSQTFVFKYKQDDELKIYIK